MSADLWADVVAATVKLRVPFPASETGQLPKGGTTLAYVGHAAITGRLLDVDPLWAWSPLATTETGLPLFDVDAQGKPVGLWITLTVCGVSRLGYGSCPPGQFDAVKVLVGDALRNAAMRFGVALDLWVKGSPELPQEQEPERPYMSALNIQAFLDKVRGEEGATLGDVDVIVSRATDGRTTDPNELFSDEVSVLRAAFESWVNERAQKATPSANELSPTMPATEDRKPGKSVPKRPLPQTEGITDVKTDGALL